LPILGICLGHQLIAHHFKGTVGRGESGEYAEVEIEILDPDTLFKGLPRHIKVWESHRDEVAKAPPDFTVLAKSEVCPVEAMRHKTKKIFGVQFHPEVEHTPQGSIILKNFIDLCEKKSLRKI
ncbi:MAG: gamma-glutamyl-gamma-aminobutyrate hydrolase family protein, partial [Candidatus Altiarchaeota archaeon]